MADFGDRIQALMDEVYSEWRKEENSNKRKWDVLDNFSEAHQIAVTFGNFNYQVENGGIEQWIYNGYFHDDSEKFAEHLAIGAETDDRCQVILDRIERLDQYAQETGSDRDGYFYDPDDEDGESSFIGDIINCDNFDTWYYDRCGKEDWWKTVCEIIDKVAPPELAQATQNEHSDLGMVGASMDKEKFWKIIDDARASGGGWKDMLDPLVDSLAQLDPQDIVHFKQIYDEYQNLANKEKLWAAAAVMNNGCSDDGFIDFRAWLLAQGKEVYVNALAEPDSLVNVAAVQAFGCEVIESEHMTPLKGYSEQASFEEMTYAASYAYEKKLGKDADIYGALDNQSLSEQEKADIAGEITYAADIDDKWTGHGVPQSDTLAELRKRCPKLYSLFNDAESHSQEKDSVLTKLREAKSQPKQPHKPKSKDKSGPEI